jgi:23S rRNA (cytidine2498-2'-O)-methyltransferase
LRAIVSRFPRGFVPIAEDRRAPSRAFAKLVEAELHLGRQIAKGEVCVDLGASPGSWSYVALQRGAQVTAIDRAELRDDLMQNPRLHFEVADAFKYKPTSVVDWLLCDVIAAPQRSIDLLLEWLSERQMRHFVVTIKFKGGDEYRVLDQLKQQAPPLCTQFGLKRLSANKNEVCAFGTRSEFSD